MLTRFVLFFSLIILFIISGCADDGHNYSGSGLIETEEAVVSAETSGRIKLLEVIEGDSVNQGDTLVIIDTSRLVLELASAQAGRKVAQANLETARWQVRQAQTAFDYAGTEKDRVEKLYNSGTASKSNLDKVTFEFNKAKEGLETARSHVATIEAEIDKIEADINRLLRQLEDCFPVSPQSGIITEKYIEQGELLAPGKAILKVARLDTVWVKVYLKAGDFANIKIGDKASVDTESGGNKYEGTVIWTASEAEFTPKNVQTEESRSNLVYAVKVNIPNDDGLLKIGMPVFVTIQK